MADNICTFSTEDVLKYDPIFFKKMYSTLTVIIFKECLSTRRYVDTIFEDEIKKPYSSTKKDSCSNTV